METRNRQILIIFIGVLILGGIGFFLYRLFALEGPTPAGKAPSLFGRLPIIGGRPGPEVPAAPPAEGIPQGAVPPREERRRLIQITDEPVIGIALDAKQQKVLYYKKRDGHLLANSFTGGAQETVSNLTILNIIEVLWSPNQRKAVILYQDGEALKKFITEATSTPKVAFLPEAAVSPAWAPDAKTLFWLQRQNQNYTLVSSGPDGKNQKSRGFTTPIPDLQLHLLTPELLALIPKTVSFFETPLFILNLRTLSQNTAAVNFGMTALGDSDAAAQFIAYSPSSRIGTLRDLHTLDVKTGKDTAWPIKTIAEKCVFGQGASALFCAVPRLLPDKDLPEAWFQGKVSFSDTIVRMNLGTGRAEQIFDEGDYDATNLVVSDDGKRVFFIDKKTGFLYGLFLE